MQANISTIWSRQIFDPTTGIYRDARNATTFSDTEICIIHAGGDLVVLSKNPLNKYGIPSTYATNNSGASGYSAHFTYDIKRKSTQFKNIGFKLSNVK